MCGLALAALLGSAVQAAPGLLIIRFDAVYLDSSGRGTSEGAPLTEVTLEEVKTKKNVSFQFPRRVEAVELEEGEYCLDYISVTKNNVFNFCELPPIRIVANQTTNAGLWRFGVEPNLRTAQRLQSWIYREEVGALAAKDFAELVNKFRAKEDHELDFVAKPSDQWTEAERKVLRTYYLNLPKGDSPPQPPQGIAAVVAAVKAFSRPGEALVTKLRVMS